MPHPVLSWSLLVGTGLQYLPRKAVHRNLELKCLLSRCFVLGLHSAPPPPPTPPPPASAPSSVFTVGQVTFFPDIFSVVQLDKVKVKAAGNFVWANHIYLVSLN